MAATALKGETPFVENNGSVVTPNRDGVTVTRLRHRVVTYKMIQCLPGISECLRGCLVWKRQEPAAKTGYFWWCRVRYESMTFLNEQRSYSLCKTVRARPLTRCCTQIGIIAVTGNCNDQKHVAWYFNQKINNYWHSHCENENRAMAKRVANEAIGARTSRCLPPFLPTMCTFYFYLPRYTKTALTDLFSQGLGLLGARLPSF